MKEKERKRGEKKGDRKKVREKKMRKKVLMRESNPRPLNLQMYLLYISLAPRPSSYFRFGGPGMQSFGT